MLADARRCWFLYRPNGCLKSEAAVLSNQLLRLNCTILSRRSATRLLKVQFMPVDGAEVALLNRYTARCFSLRAIKGTPCATMLTTNWTMYPA